MITSRLHRLRRRDPAEMNITAFMNLMVILVPFLLITAVFSRLAVMQLALPAPDSEPADPDSDLPRLSVVVRSETLAVAVNGGVLQTFSATDGDGFDYIAVNDLMQQVRERTPEEVQNITLLMEPDIEYDVMIQVMDAVRSARPTTATIGSGEPRPTLFPEVAIGDAGGAPAGNSEASP